MSPEMARAALEIAAKQASRLTIKYGPRTGEMVIAALRKASEAAALACEGKSEPEARIIVRAIIADINQCLTESQNLYEHESDKERNRNHPGRS